MMSQGQGHQIQRGTTVRTQESLDLDSNPSSSSCCCSASVPQFPHLSSGITATASQGLERIPRGLQRGPVAPGGAAGEGLGGRGLGPWLSCSPAGFSGWAHLAEVDPDEEVQGEIHLRLEVVRGTQACLLRCSVLEAR